MVPTFFVYYYDIIASAPMDAKKNSEKWKGVPTAQILPTDAHN